MDRLSKLVNDGYDGLITLALVCAVALMFAPNVYAQQKYERPELRADGKYAGETIRVQGPGDAMTAAEKAQYRITTKTEYRFYEWARPKPPVLSDTQLVNVPCTGPSPLPTPPLQDAFSGVWESLTYPGDFLTWVIGDPLTMVNLNLGDGRGSSIFQLAGVESERVVPLYEPETGTANQIGAVKLCSPTFNYCRELLIRVAIEGEVIVPDPGFHLQRFGALIPVAGSECAF